MLRSGRVGPTIPAPVDPSVEDPTGGRFPRYGLPPCSSEGFHPFDSTVDCSGPVYRHEDTVSTVVDGKGWLTGCKYVRKVYTGKLSFHAEILSEYEWLGSVGVAQYVM